MKGSRFSEEQIIGILREHEARFGPISRSHPDRRTSIRLIGQEVLPAVREMGKELGLVDPFEREPGSRQYIQGTAREPVVSLRHAASAPS